MADGNGVQERGQTTSEETAATRFFRNSDPQAIVAGGARPRGCRIHGLQKLRARFGLSSLAGVVGSLMKETIPVRQRGQGIEPGGPTISDVMLLVEQR